MEENGIEEAFQGCDLVEEPPIEFDETAIGCTYDEMQTTLKILKMIDANPALLDIKETKELRTVAFSVFVEKSDRNKAAFGGTDETQYKHKRYLKMEAKRRDAAKREKDRQYINSSALRKERISALNSLMEKQEVTVAKLLTNGDDVPDPEEKFGKLSEKSDEELHNLRSCYICKVRFYKIHHFYDNLCPECAALAFEKRNQSADLRGKVAIITGGRIKIGYLVSLKLLRCGATLIVTTRFPHDSADRFAKEPDFNEWKDRLHVFGLDLRDMKRVEEFTQSVTEKFDRLDILINNAAQTVRKPPAYYSHLMANEMKPLEDVPAEIRPLFKFSSEYGKDHITIQPLLLTNLNMGDEETPVQDERLYNPAERSNISTVNVSAAMSQAVLLPGDEIHDVKEFPIGKYDVFQQQLDLRRDNSWLMKLGDVATIELIEVTTVNSLSPFILCSKLKPLFLKSPAKDKYIINVSAMEGKFYRHKTANHPHTNMAKASLNMLTRTSAADYCKDNIYMNAVDTGWVTDENPFHKAQAHSGVTNFFAPLDEAEAMARILDPVFVGLNTGVNEYGKFFKDYHETEW
eukprot:TRINITY_DN4481_c0_g1_i1.p1 TRINITY_DN4481_c0_g1~~TRINITY_DN4481_c0_g1_i1.p1  ORF type:complete len:575 (-),score=176.63 TRINITY_DN4481_c0_g1_i1:45-1769(-)